MMMTPSRRRSFQDHRQYYENIKPKVISRWENGTPKIRNGKIVRRMTDTFYPDNAKSTPINAGPKITVDEEDDVFDIDEKELSVQEADISSSLDDSSQKLNHITDHFKKLIIRLDEYTKSKNIRLVERQFIRRQINIFTNQSRQIEQSLNEVYDRSERLDKFLKNREQGLDWSEWGD